MSREHIHFVTGRLAEFALRKVLEPLAQQVGFDYTVEWAPGIDAMIGVFDRDKIVEAVRGQVVEIRRLQVGRETGIGNVAVTLIVGKY